MKDILHQYGLLFGSLLLAAVFCAFVLSVLPGCGLSSSSDGLRYVMIGESLEIDEGQTVRLGGDGPYLRFDDVSEDSRCPTNVVCIWQGMAVAEFSMISAAGDSVFSMAIPGLVQTPYEENEIVVIAGFELTMLDLSPYPDAEQDETPSRYRALIRVERDGSAQE